MPTAHLALARQASPPAVFRYLNGAVEQVGNTFGTAESPAAPSGVDMGAQRVCQFKGSNDLYALNFDDVYQYNKGTGNWTSVHTLANVSATSDSTRIGPIVMQVNGVPTMVVIYPGVPTTEWRIATSVDGTTWNTSSALTAGTNHGGQEKPVWNPIVVGQTVWFFFSNTVSVVHYMGVNPSTGTITTVVAQGQVIPAGSSWFLPAACVWDGVHYVVGWTVSGTRAALYSFDGAVFTQVIDFTGADGIDFMGPASDTKFAIFTDGTDLFCLTKARYSPDSYRGWYCWRVEPGLTDSNITAAVVPTALGPNGAGNVADDGGFGVIIDQEANPGGVPEIYLYYRADGLVGTPWQVYKWNGFGTPIGNGGSPTGSGGDGSHCMGFDGIGSGKVFWSQDQLDCSIESIAQALGGQLVSFRLYSESGTETVDVDFFYSAEGESAQSGPATLLNASAGTINANVIEGLTADNGTTLYTVLWNTTATGDNIANGTSANLQARVSV